MNEPLTAKTESVADFVSWIANAGEVPRAVRERARALLPVETSALRLPDDAHELLVTTARDAGFSDTQWKAMFFEQGPYDVTFPCFTTKKFIALLLKRLQMKTSVTGKT